MPTVTCSKTLVRRTLLAPPSPAPGRLRSTSAIPTPPELRPIPASTRLAVHSRWRTLLEVELRYDVLWDVPASGRYAYAGGRYLAFLHRDLPGKRITITTSAGTNILPLLFASPATHQMNALSEYELLSPYVDMMVRQEATFSHSQHAWSFAGNPRPMITPAPSSPFPSLRLRPSTRTWTRPCGRACPYEWRFGADGKGIGHWNWGGFDDCGFDPDPNRLALLTSDMKWRTGPIALHKSTYGQNFFAAQYGSYAPDEMCFTLDDLRTPFQAMIFGRVIRPAMAAKNRRTLFALSFWCSPPQWGWTMIETRKAQMWVYASSFLAYTEDTQYNKRVDVCTNVDRTTRTGGSFIDIHLSHAGGLYCTTYTPDDESGDLEVEHPRSSEHYSFARGDWVLALVTYHTCGLGPFSPDRSYELLARHIRVLPNRMFNPAQRPRTPPMGPVNDSPNSDSTLFSTNMPEDPCVLNTPTVVDVASTNDAAIGGGNYQSAGPSTFFRAPEGPIEMLAPGPQTRRQKQRIDAVEEEIPDLHTPRRQRTTARMSTGGRPPQLDCTFFAPCNADPLTVKLPRQVHRDGADEPRCPWDGLLRIGRALRLLRPLRLSYFIEPL
ncbi:hypothetical protein B0H17DRAFT_1133337 [Mycena rosella]|uniref:Uncharacterized protein n=1 Tax=Mycena rosella TaxID=1033263 RepID=A0AAD7DJ37_MYCRO|nr:hypothetical protein B0H17DRAFT_1133337 [Mycena rosella]